MREAQIFPVSGEAPEARVFVTQLAMEFRQTSQKDVVIDMYCYRRHGHNEGDEPSFTQPLMYAKIKERPTLTEVYTETLILRGDLTVDETEAINREFQAKLQAAVEEVKSGPRPTGMSGYGGRWSGLSRHYSHAPVPTGVAQETLQRITEAMAATPQGFTVHPKIVRLLESRLQDMKDGKSV